jgi:hypothetical protein
VCKKGNAPAYIILSAHINCIDTLLANRYPYYALSVLEFEVEKLTWLRYSAWIPLYPVGFTCEGECMVSPATCVQIRTSVFVEYIAMFQCHYL